MRKKLFKKILLSFLLVIIIFLLGIVIYMLIPRTASDAAKSKITQPSSNIITEYNENEIVCSPKNSNPDIGIIFYTGAKIEHYAYGYMLADLAENNVLCIAEDNFVHIPFFSTQDCDNIFERFPNINKWYFAGHSLGGEVADRQALKFQDRVKGAINLGAHLRQNFSSSSLRLLSIYASNDTLANSNVFYMFENNLPQNRAYFVIEGGCHAYFGDFGTMLTDGVPEITPEEQAQASATQILKFVTNS